MKKKDISWREQSDANGKTWDHRCDSHLKEWYRLDAFRAGGLTLDDLQLSEVGDVSGKTLLHLQCNVGLDTLSWERQGARVMGVDISSRSIETARNLTCEFGMSAEFQCCDIYDLPDKLSQTFDIVYTSQGVLCWLNDLKKWAQVIAHHLNPGGFFYIMEEHPFSVTLDDQELRPHPYYPYFHIEEADHEDGTTFQWYWALSDVVNALIQAGLQIDFLNEHDKTFWQRVPYMESDDNRWWYVPGFKWPLMFTLKASK